MKTRINTPFKSFHPHAFHFQTSQIKASLLSLLLFDTQTIPYDHSWFAQYPNIPLQLFPWQTLCRQLKIIQQPAHRWINKKLAQHSIIIDQNNKSPCGNRSKRHFHMKIKSFSIDPPWQEGKPAITDVCSVPVVWCLFSQDTQVCNTSTWEPNSLDWTRRDLVRNVIRKGCAE